jgi:Na+-translocating ferredoxin:NAD+ oxidoreductase RnfD subunit
MSAPAALTRTPGIAIRGTRYPVVLPSLRDPRLHLAAVIVSLQVLGQVAFEFRLSIAQILISIGTCAVLEVALVARRQRMLVWPASALLTGNGVAFVLRVPGTEHGDWWSLDGWWIFAGTAAVSLLSKYVIRFRGAHVFNPSNFGLVLCFLLLGPARADPLDFWWGPMSPALALALAIIVVGGFLILSRLRLIAMAVSFWLVFVVVLAVVVATGHAITARWHLGPVEGLQFWTVLAFSPEVLVFLFFMLTDPRTVPSGRRARIVFGISVALLAALLIAPARTEFWAKVALLAALALVCAARPALAVLASSRRPAGRTAGALVAAGLVAYAGALVAAGLPARPGPVPAAVRPATQAVRLPPVVVRPSRGVDSTLDRKTARQIAADVVAALAARRQLHRIVLWLEGGSDQAALVIAQVEVPGGKTTTVELSFSRAGYEIGRVRR